MSTKPLLIFSLVLAPVLPTRAAESAEPSVCGSVEVAISAALPASARAELVPVVRGYSWSLAILGEGVLPEPEAAARIEGGRFCLEVPRAGMWQVLLRTPGFVPLRSAPLALTGSRELPPARLTPDAGIRARVRSAAGEPAPGAWVLATPAVAGQWNGMAGEGWRPALRFGKTDAKGRVTLPRAGGEDLELSAFVPGRTQAAHGPSAASAGAAELRLAATASARTINVVDERGEALPGVVFTLSAHGWPVAVSDALGRATLELSAGSTVPLLLEGPDGRRSVVNLSAADEPLRQTLPPTPRVSGRALTGAERRELSGAIVWLGADPGTFALTGPRGEFTLPGGSRQRLRVEVGAAGFLPRTVAVSAGELAAGKALELLLEPAGAAAGRVLDAVGAPLSGVALVARPSGAEPAPSFAWSDAGGRFELRSLAPGATYAVTAERAGLVSRTLPGVVVAVGSAVDLGAIVLKPGANLEGRVTDGRGAPITGVELRALVASSAPNRGRAERLRAEPPAASTGRDGRFTLRDLPPARPLHLLATKPGYLPAWTPGVEAPTPQPLAIVLREATRLSGALVDEGGAPVAGGRVVLRWVGPAAGRVGLEPRRGDGARSATTDGQGAFAFTELEPGGIELSATAEGFLPARPVTLELTPTGEVGELRLVMRQGAELSGRVSGPRGEPVSGARLRAGTAEAASGEDGLYRLRGLPVGALGLSVHHPDFRVQVKEVQIEPGTNTADVALEEGFHLSGRTLDETGLPLAGVRLEVTAEGPRGWEGHTALSRADGRFKVVVGTASTYLLQASREGFAPRTIGGLTVPRAGLEVVLDRGASVGGRLLGVEAEELAWVEVEARRADLLEPESAATGTVDPQGRYAIHHLGFGAWRLRATVAGGRRQAEATVTIERTTSRVERDLELGGGLRLKGHLLYAGEPVVGAHVALAGLDVAAERSVLSGHDGAFEIAGLAPGRYRLDVLEEARALSHVEDLELGADRELVLELEAARLAGTVSSAASGEPLAEALVYVQRILGSGELGPLLTVGTDRAGSFVVAHLTLGHYLVTARKDGYAPAEQRVEVVAATPLAALALRLAPAEGLTLLVHLSSGGAPRFATVNAFDPSGRNVLNETIPVTDRGYLALGELPAGSWNLLVSAAGGAPTWVQTTVPGPTPEVVLPPAAPLTVRVPALADSGAAGILTLTGERGDLHLHVDPGGSPADRWTITAGLATLTDVPAGVWTVRVEGTHGGAFLGTVTTDGLTPQQISLE